MRTAARQRPMVHAIRGHLGQPLRRTGYALSAAGLTTSILGLVYWIVAARLYSDRVVGAASAVVAALLLASGASQLSMNAGLVRFLPAAGPHGGRLVVRVYAVAAAVSVAAGCAAALIVASTSPDLGFLGGAAWVAAFAAACAVWSVFALQDSALTGLRHAEVVLVENTLFAVAKIGLLVALAGLGTVSGVVASWVIPAALALVPINALLFRRLLPRHESEPVSATAAPVSRALITRFVAGNHLATLLGLGAITVLPIAVAALEGAARNAYFFAAWSIATALQLLPTSLGSSLTGEAARNLATLPGHCRAVLREMLLLLGIAAAGLMLVAPQVLSLFGDRYAAEAATALRILAVAAVPAGVVTVAVAVARVTDRPRTVLLLTALQALGGLGPGLALLRTDGLTGLAVGWLMGQSVAAAAAYAAVLRPTLRGTG